MKKAITLRSLLNILQLMHQAEVVKPDGTKAPLVDDWDQQGTVEHGFTVLIPEESLLPCVALILQQLGFEYLLDEQFYMFTGAPFEYENGTNPETEGNEEELVPDCLVTRGTIDSEMVDAFMGRKEGYLPPDLIEDFFKYHQS